ncbi:hypothetical protein ABK040_010136 [Willaertia magna]
MSQQQDSKKVEEIDDSLTTAGSEKVSKGQTVEELYEGEEDFDISNIPTELPEWVDKNHPLFSPNFDPNSAAAQALQDLKYDGTPDEIATNFKNQGNSLLKESSDPKKYYKDIIKYYTEGLEQKITDMKLKIDLLNNRSHVYILMQNYGKAIEDAKEVLKIDSNNTKAMFRIAKAASALEKWKTVIRYSEKALKIEKTHPLFESLIKKAEEGLRKKHEKKAELRDKKRKEQQIPQQVKDFLGFTKGIKIGDYTELESNHMNTYTDQVSTGGLKIDHVSGEVFFSVIFVYDEFNQTDFIELFSENQTLLEQLEMMFPPNGPVFPYGCEEDYVLSNLRVSFLDPKSLKETNDRYIEIKNFNTPLIDILKRKDYLLPSTLMPVFHIIRKNTTLDVNIK